MAKRILSGSIALSKLIHVAMEKQGKNGMVKGMFIPYEVNHLIEGKEKTVYLNVSVHVKDEADQYGQHGFISQTVDSKRYKEATYEQREAFKKLPILGNIKDFQASSNDNSGAVSEVTYNADSGDDLLF